MNKFNLRASALAVSMSLLTANAFATAISADPLTYSYEAGNTYWTSDDLGTRADTTNIELDVMRWVDVDGVDFDSYANAQAFLDSTENTTGWRWATLEEITALLKFFDTDADGGLNGSRDTFWDVNGVTPYPTTGQYFLTTHLTETSRKSIEINPAQANPTYEIANGVKTLGAAKADIALTTSNPLIVRNLYTPPVAGEFTLDILSPISTEATGFLTSVELVEPLINNGVEPIELVSDAAESYGVGSHQITWTATDADGTQATTVQLITITDTTAPVFELTELADVSIDAEGLTTEYVSPQPIIANDLVDGALEAANNGPFAVGTHVMSWKVADTAGNTATLTQNLEVVSTYVAPAEENNADGLLVSSIDDSLSYTSNPILPYWTSNNLGVKEDGEKIVLDVMRWGAADVVAGSWPREIYENTAPKVDANGDQLYVTLATEEGGETGEAVLSYDENGDPIFNDENGDPIYVMLDGSFAAVNYYLDSADNFSGWRWPTVEEMEAIHGFFDPEQKGSAAAFWALNNAPVPEGKRYFTAPEARDQFIDDNVADQEGQAGMLFLIFGAASELLYEVENTIKHFHRFNPSFAERAPLLVRDKFEPLVEGVFAIVPKAKITKEATGLLTPVELETPVVAYAQGNASVPTADNLGPYPVGTTKVTWTATDQDGKQATRVQLIAITDSFAPAFTVESIPDATIEAFGVLTAYKADGLVTATDEIEGEIIPTNDGPYTKGTHVITWKASDSSGNYVTMTQNLTVVAPVEVEKSSNGSGSFGIFAFLIGLVGFGRRYLK